MSFKFPQKSEIPDRAPAHLIHMKTIDAIQFKNVKLSWTIVEMH